MSCPLCFLFFFFYWGAVSVFCHYLLTLKDFFLLKQRTIFALLSAAAAVVDYNDLFFRLSSPPSPWARHFPSNSLSLSLSLFHHSPYSFSQTLPFLSVPKIRCWDLHFIIFSVENKIHTQTPNFGNVLDWKAPSSGLVHLTLQVHQ